MKQAYFKILGEQTKTLSLEDFMVLGKDPSQCAVAIPDQEASDRHARIEIREAGYILKDLRSSSGTFVNETRVLEAVLMDGDLIRIGRQEILFTLSAEDRPEFTLSSKNAVWNQELQALASVAITEFPVLLLGASGTGKDVIAQALHDSSYRRKGPFVSVNCSALSENLIESELFGHIKGSFTGATSDRKGAFESARGGTLFLDEIGDLSYALQAKLLRALENNEIRPVGADRNIKTDIRIIAATHQGLPQKIRNGSFRSDLYFRLNVVSVTPPLLAHRMEDFETLLYSFAKKMRVRFSFNAILRLKKHPWPGNIRELKNLVSRAAALYPQQSIEEHHIEKLIDRSLLAGSAPTTNIQETPVIKEIERQMILKRLEANYGNQRKTAQDLGMPKSTLHDRLKHYRIDINTFKV